MSHSNSLSSLAKRIEEMKEKLDVGKDHLASVIGAEIIRLYGALLLDYTDTELKALVKYFDVEKSIQQMERDKKTKQKSGKTSFSGSGQNTV